MDIFYRCKYKIYYNIQQNPKFKNFQAQPCWMKGLPLVYLHGAIGSSYIFYSLLWEINSKHTADKILNEVLGSFVGWLSRLCKRLLRINSSIDLVLYRILLLLDYQYSY